MLLNLRKAQYDNGGASRGGYTAPPQTEFTAQSPICLELAALIDKLDFVLFYSSVAEAMLLVFRLLPTRSMRAENPAHTKRE